MKESNWTLKDDKNPNFHDIGKRLKKVRTGKGDLIKETAWELGVRPDSYYRYECGTRMIPTEKLIRFCRTYSVSSDSILFGDDKRSDGEKADMDINLYRDVLPDTGHGDKT